MNSKKEHWIESIRKKTEKEPLYTYNDLCNESPHIDYHSVYPHRIELKGDFYFWQLEMIMRHMYSQIKERGKDADYGL